jgi:hypothetical protein
VDQGHRVARLADSGIVPPRECRSCAVTRWATGDRAQVVSAYVAEDIDENVVVISGSDFEGLVVVPRQHLGGLEELPVHRRADVLAALRRATRSVLERNPGTSTQVVVLTDPPASEGHACFQVLPGGPG